MRLTTRELQVLVGVSMGFKDREIAERLKIAYDTERVHLVNLWDKLGTHRRTLLVRIFFTDVCIVPEYHRRIADYSEMYSKPPP